MSAGFRQKTPDELARPTAAGARASARLPLTLILEDVRSGNNVGSVFRTADAFAVAQLLLVGITPQPPHREILKTSLGAEDAVPWRYFPTVGEAIALVRASGISVFALEQTTESVALAGSGFADRLPAAVVLGNEVRGVSPEALRLVDGTLEIEQFGHKHSLNVSVAAGVLAFAGRHRIA